MFAIAFFCIVGGVYSLFLLGDCYVQWKARSGGGEGRSPAHRDKRYPRSWPKDWWCQAISGVTFLVVVAMLLPKTWEDSRQLVDGYGGHEAPFLQVPGMLAVPRANIARDRDRPRQPICGANLAGFPVTDADIHALLKEGAEIEYLILNGTDITDEGLAYLRQLPRLKELGLGRTQITDSGCEELAQIGSLEELALFSTGITDEGLKHLSKLTNLRSLDLRNTATMDSSLKSLERLNRLEQLLVSETNVTDQGVRDLKERLPRLVCYR